MELKMMINVLQWITKIQPKVKSFILRNCYSDFLQTTFIPIPFTNPYHHPSSPSPQQTTIFYSPLRNLNTDKRRLEYMKQDYDLYDQLSIIFGKLFSVTPSSSSELTHLEMTGCDLDMAMTDLFIMMMNGVGKNLTTWIDQQNYHSSTLFPSTDLLQALVVSCPRIKHFINDYKHITDHVILTMAKHWYQLTSLSLTSSSSSSSAFSSSSFSSSSSTSFHSMKSSSSSSNQSTATSSPISSYAFFELILKCQQLHTLQLDDMDFINQQDLFNMLDWKDKQHLKKYPPPPPSSISRYHPYNKGIRNYYKKNTIGSSLKQLTITKYVTSPLTCHGISNLMVLFPQLEQVQYYTNPDCYFMTMGMRKDQFSKEKSQIMKWCQSSPFHFIPSWDQPSTMEQRLLKSMVSLF
ncbi:hypothetical protein BJ944DRAFT_274143 [Cunninghamella echinulata]|nr:hypothetical protein BJ944DRAFT_274143 [Cunninghamella echinulata]